MRKYDFESLKHMIDEGDLITIDQIESGYGLTREQVEEAIRDGDLETVRCTRKDYFHTCQVEMLKDAIREEEAAEE